MSAADCRALCGTALAVCPGLLHVPTRNEAPSDWQSHRGGPGLPGGAAGSLADELEVLWTFKKERAMHDRFTRRARSDLGKLGKRLKRARKNTSRNDVERQVGRILERNSCAGRRFDVKVIVESRRGS